jgi:hypothetical protein
MGNPRDGADASRRAAIIDFLKGRVKAISHQRPDHSGNMQIAGTYRSMPPSPRHPAGCPLGQSDGAT